MKIAIGADHRGFEQKKAIQEKVRFAGNHVEWIDVGAYDIQRSDYPLFAKKVCDAIKSGKANYGVLLCGSGIGVNIAANRFQGIYAALVWNEMISRVAKEHDNVNVLCLPSDFINNEQAVALVENWLNAEFKNGRYLKRLQMIDSWGGL